MSTNLHRGTFQVFTYPADIIVNIGFDRIIDQVFLCFVLNIICVYTLESDCGMGKIYVDDALTGLSFVVGLSGIARRTMLLTLPTLGQAHSLI